jgi:hypothetical protein
MRVSSVAALCSVVVFASCSPPASTADSGAESGYPYNYRRPEVPPGGLLMESERFTVQPGDDVLMCTFTPVVLDRPFETRQLHSYQMRGGHHAVLYYTENVRRGDLVGRTHPCTDEDMTDLRLIGGGDESMELQLRLPEGIGFRIPADAQIVIQSHYINVDSVPRDVRDAVVAVPAPPGSLREFADAFAINDGDFAIPPRSMYGRVIEWDITREMNLALLLGHTHEYGTRFQVELIRAGASTAGMLYNESGPELGRTLRSNPPVRYFEGANALALRPGDRLRVRCEWNNTTSHVLRFPEEMCVAFMYYYPGAGFLSGGRVVETIGGGGDAGVMGMGNAGCSSPRAPGEPCVRTCNTGNEVGVGRYCTRGGNECSRNRSAILCTADFAADAPAGWCTKPCSSDEGCGSGAVCTGDSRGRGCTPVECIGPAPDAGAGADASAESGATPDASMIDAAMDL